MNVDLKKLTAITIIVATLALAGGYSLEKRWFFTLGIAVLGLAWLWAQQRDWHWLTSPALFSFITLAAIAVQQGLSVAWMLLGVIGGLVAWDLGRFAQRLGQTPNVYDISTIEQIHFRRLLLVAGAALFLGLATLKLHVSLNFGWAIFLSLLMVLSLSLVVGLIRRSGEPS
jgi:hypothetical protein